MRLRTFTARSMPDAMALVRQHLGPDAIILSTKSARTSISVTAALEDETPASRREAAPPSPTDDPAEIAHEALAAHGTPARLVELLLAAIVEIGAGDPILALAGGLDAVFAFAPLMKRRPAKPLMLVGPPGAGKTISIAKLATKAVLAGHQPRVISSDTVRAGGIAQLEAFTRLLGVELLRAGSAEQMERHAGAARDELVLIDSGGINPYSAGDRAELAELITAAGAEPVFVLPAGGDVFDAVEMAQAFAGLGATRLIVTRLDMVHRLGSLLAAAHATHLSFCDAGVSADVAEGLVPLNPVARARHHKPQAAQASAPLTPERAQP